MKIHQITVWLTTSQGNIVNLDLNAKLWTKCLGKGKWTTYSSQLALEAQRSSTTNYKIKIDKKETFKENKSMETFLDFLFPNIGHSLLCSLMSFHSFNFQDQFHFLTSTTSHLYYPDFICQKLNKSLIW